MYIYISKIDYTYDNTIQHTYVYVNKVKENNAQDNSFHMRLGSTKNT